MFVGVDIGGTHTDIAAFDPDQKSVYSRKVPSTPDNFMRGVLHGLEELADHREDSLQKLLAEDVVILSHGTTVGTNALLEREGVRTGLLTTDGFTDHYHMARMNRVETTELSREARPDVLVPRNRTLGIEERVDSLGEEVVPLSEDDVVRQAEALIENHGVEAIAVSFLWSHMNPDHEIRAQRIIETEYPDVFVSRGSRLAPFQGEFERTSTTVMNCYLSPRVADYLERLETHLLESGFDAPLYVMTCDGGVSTVDVLKEEGISTLHSGPAAGVVGAAKVLRGEEIGTDLVTFDMGGTSTDVGMIAEGQAVSKEEEVVDRLPLSQVMVDVTSVGAGGGSIARVEGGSLKVGPESAGADPGPACFGREDNPTVTDANLILGYLNPERYLDGRVDIDPGLAEAALEKHIAEPLGRSVQDAAKGVYRIVNSVMADAIREVTVNRGYDPREFGLVVYGGAGGFHGTAVADEMGMENLLIPPVSNVFSALGLLAADLSYTHSQYDRVGLDDLGGNPGKTVDELNDVFGSVDEEVLGVFEQQGFSREDMELQRSVKVGYQDQALEVEIDVPSTPLNESSFQDLVDQFRTRFNDIFGEGSAYPEAGLLFKKFKSTAYAVDVPSPEFETEFEETRDASPARVGDRSAFDRGHDEFVTMDVMDGSKLEPGMAIDGPAILEYPETTLVLHHGDQAKVDSMKGLTISLGETSS